MKIYLFHPETGIYFGEFLADEMPTADDSLLAPLKATTIAPPEGGGGHILVFDAVAQCWEVHTHAEQEGPQLVADPVTPSRGHVHCYSGSLLIFFGVLLVFTALCDDNKGVSVMCGLSLVLGSAAYISIKERILNPSKNTRVRKYTELVFISIIAIGCLYEIVTQKINSNMWGNSITSIASLAIYWYLSISPSNQNQAIRNNNSKISNNDC